MCRHRRHPLITGETGTTLNFLGKHTQSSKSQHCGHPRHFGNSDIQSPSLRGIASREGDCAHPGRSRHCGTEGRRRHGQEFRKTLGALGAAKALRNITQPRDSRHYRDSLVAETRATAPTLSRMGKPSLEPPARPHFQPHRTH